MFVENKAEERRQPDDTEKGVADGFAERQHGDVKKYFDARKKQQERKYKGGDPEPVVHELQGRDGADLAQPVGSFQFVAEQQLPVAGGSGNGHVFFPMDEVGQEGYRHEKRNEEQHKTEDLMRAFVGEKVPDVAQRSFQAFLVLAPADRFLLFFFFSLFRFQPVRFRCHPVLIKSAETRDRCGKRHAL